MHITLRPHDGIAEVLTSGSTTLASLRLAVSQSPVSAARTALAGHLGV
ncbi:MAG: LysR family transcriptional regulator, partial [Citrobacter portucalensis]